MQVMPATGAELKVGDIHQAEPNIHAGIKYMDQLMTRYFKDAKFSEQNRHPVIIVDEAHLIEDIQVFQALRLLLNFQEQDKCRFSLIFVGQRELLNTVRRLGQLEERLSVKCLLRPLSAEETAAYVTHRLEAAGSTRPIFEPTAMQPLHELSGGVPRRINRLCDLALLVGFADGSSSISPEQVEAVAQELTAIVPD
jgi:general secretion pathway protein A